MDTCHDCIAAKITRRPFPKTKEPRERRALDLILVVWSARLTDDYSGYRFGFPIVRQTGSEILNCLLSIIPYVERQTSNTLKAIRSDNALEFTKGGFAKKLKQMGIEHELTILYEHEQAGLAESTNCVIIDKARTMLLSKEMDLKFWPDAVQSAVFVANRSWHYGSKGIPYEKFTGRKANVEMLRVFGSWCWARRPAEHILGSHKLDKRGILCQMLGYKQHGHAYRLFDVESRKVFTATHVVFDEYATSPPKQGLLQEILAGGDISRLTKGESIHIGFSNGNVNTHMDIHSDASDGSYTDAGKVGDSDGVGLAEAQFDEENAGDHVDNKEQKVWRSRQLGKSY
jgi:hypothetical protein